MNEKNKTVQEPLIGAHVGIGGGLSKAIPRALEIGANCIQIFVSAPQQWREPAHPDKEVQLFIDAYNQSNFRAIFLHAIYLLNPAAPNTELREKSISSIISYLHWGKRLGAQGVVIHLGSSSGTTREEAEKNLVNSVKTALDNTDEVPVLLETSAGTKNSLGSTFDDLARILYKIGDTKRAAICLDTAHIWAAGYDLSSEDAVNQTFEEFDQKIGLDKLKLIHANDTNVRIGGGRDRHENIGEGIIGERGWKALLTNPGIRFKPWILETPQIADKNSGAEQIKKLRQWWEGKDDIGT